MGKVASLVLIAQQVKRKSNPKNEPLKPRPFSLNCTKGLRTCGEVENGSDVAIALLKFKYQIDPIYLIVAKFRTDHRRYIAYIHCGVEHTAA